MAGGAQTVGTGWSMACRDINNNHVIRSRRQWREIGCVAVLNKKRRHGYARKAKGLARDT